MADHDPSGIPSPPPAAPGARCPWCSAPIASPEDVTCGACGATLHGDAAIEIPGVTAIDVQHAMRARAPRKSRGSLGSLFRSGDDAIPPATESELPAVAMPDPEVRREMLRLQLEAELADLTARAAALAAERGIPMPVIPATVSEPAAELDMAAPTAGTAGAAATVGTTPSPDADGAATATTTPAPDATPPEDDARPRRARPRRARP